MGALVKGGKATLVRKMDDGTWKGEASLYKLEPPLFGDVSHAIVSAVGPGEADPVLDLIGTLLGVPGSTGDAETLLIPTDSDGADDSPEGSALNKAHAEDLIGLINRSTTDHTEFLSGVGYEVQGD